MIDTKFKQPKTENIVVRVREEDKASIKKLSSYLGESISEFIRISIDERMINEKLRMEKKLNA